jgi:DoxX-like family
MSIRAVIVRQVSEEGQMKLNRMLWAVQGVLALLFLFAGGMKLALPIDALKGPVELPGAFMRFIGVAEVFGAIGLIAPGALRIRTALTPLAAAGLTIIMIGATVVTVAGGSVAGALVPFVVGVLAVSVGFGRLELSPIVESRRSISNVRRPLGAVHAARA